MDGNIYEQSIWQRMGMRHPGGRESTCRLAELANQFWGKSYPKELINLCCGSGEGMDVFRGAGFSVTGIDCSQELILQAKTDFPDMEWICGNAEELPFSIGKFTCALSECSLSEAENLPKRLAEIYRVLKPQGLLVTADVENEEERKQWDKCFLEAGFKLLYREAHTKWMREFLAHFLWEASLEEEKLLCTSWKKWKHAEYVLAVYRRC